MRCFLKLAGTRFWPDMEGKILLLEASGGEAAQMASCLAQLRQIGVFEQIRGILLGTFLSVVPQAPDGFLAGGKRLRQKAGGPWPVYYGRYCPLFPWKARGLLQ